MGLQRFERRLERLVEGTFSKAFRSGLQPVEIGRRLVREMDAGRTLGVRGTVVPNHFTVLALDARTSSASPASTTRCVSELADAVREHARDEELPLRRPGRGRDRARRHARRRGDLAGRRRDRRRRRRASPARSCSPTAAASRSATSPRSSAACPTARSRSPTRRSRATTPRSGATSSGFRVVDLGSTNGTHGQRRRGAGARAQRRRRDRRRRNRRSATRSRNGHMSDPVLTVLEVLPARAALPVPRCGSCWIVARELRGTPAAPRRARRRPAPAPSRPRPTRTRRWRLVVRRARGRSRARVPDRRRGDDRPRRRLHGPARVRHVRVAGARARRSTATARSGSRTLGSTQRHVRERQAHRTSR